MSAKPNPLTRGKKQKALALLQRNQLTEAQPLLERVCHIDPRDAETWYLLGGIKHHQGHHEAAAICYERAANLEPQNPDTHYYLANALSEIGRFGEATQHYLSALALRPNFIEAHCNLGAAFEQQKNFAQATEHYRLALRADPSRIELHYNLGNALKALGQYAEAETSYRHVLEQRPDHAKTNNNLGNMLADQGRFDEAIVCFQRVLELCPNHADASNNLGNVLADQGRFDEAIACLQQALTIHPDHLDLNYNLGSLLRDCGRIVEAISHYDLALARRPDFVEAHWNRALALLLLGDFKRGWSDYEWKWRREGKIRPLPPSPWVGINLAGRQVFLHAEQGLGDELFFLRFADQLKRHEVDRIIYRPGKKIASLLSRVRGIDRLAASEETPSTADTVFSVGDLPRLLRMERAEQIPPPLALSPLPEQLDILRKQLAALGPPPYMGVTWRAGTKEESGRRRTLYKEFPVPPLARLLGRFPATLLILQRHPKPGEVESFREALGRPVHDFSALNDDLEQMLALLALLDDYVGVSNTNMHLRAGVGKTARVLVPAPPEWRWMAEGKESPWFPGFSVYRQGYDGSWEGAFDMLAADLKITYGI